MAETGRGVIQMISDAYQSLDDEYVAAEMHLMRSLVEATGRPLSMTVQQPEPLPDRWREMAAWVDRCVAAGLPLKTQVAARPIGVLQGSTASVNPFVLCPSFRQIADLPLPEMVAALRDPERRQRIIDEHDTSKARRHPQRTGRWVPQVVPHERSGRLRAARVGVRSPRSRPRRVAIRSRSCSISCVERDGNQLLYMPLFNYASGQPGRRARDAVDAQRAHGSQRRRRALRRHQRRQHDHHGAGAVDPDRHAGGTLPLELMVHHITQRTAQHVGWFDRGVLAPGHLADINVIDMDALAAHPPSIVHDLPAGGRRLMQTASGYRHTFKRGVESFANGEHTGALNGTLVRGPQSHP